ncbi:MAG: Flp family type IVb pilin [Planctomycetota bacterium]|jgi:Flp pilus assembly pilin Flp
MNILKRFVKDEKGMETVEWAVLAALIVAGLIGVITTLGGNVLTAFTSLSTAKSSMVGENDWFISMECFIISSTDWSRL